MIFTSQFAVLAVLLSSSAIAQTQTSFSSCLENGGERGGLLFTVDDTKIPSAHEAFGLMSELFYMGFYDLYVNEASEWNHDVKPVRIAVQRIFARIPKDRQVLYIDEQGRLNPELVKEMDNSLEALMIKFPAIKAVKCIPVPGPGGRVGG